MATSTFDKKIVIGPAAAKRLAAALNNPYRRPLPDLTEEKKRGEEAWQIYLKKSAKSLPTTEEKNS
ncbi:MAG: hypothetical protein LBM98_07640 [Oscillospiraceae bacterium]|nr:hypothetical protein [Oscillospiraceae bacterium]